MQPSTPPLTAFYTGWPEYQRLLVEAIAPLSAEQPALQAAHIIGTRVGWFHLGMKEGDPTVSRRRAVAYPRHARPARLRPVVRQQRPSLSARPAPPRHRRGA
jgi:hypothetical protein